MFFISAMLLRLLYNLLLFNYNPDFAVETSFHVLCFSPVAPGATVYFFFYPFFVVIEFWGWVTLCVKMSCKNILDMAGFDLTGLDCNICSPIISVTVTHKCFELYRQLLH